MITATKDFFIINSFFDSDALCAEGIAIKLWCCYVFGLNLNRICLDGSPNNPLHTLHLPPQLLQQ